MRNFREFEVWKRAIQVCKDIYKVTNTFPDSEKFGIVSQIRRASVSIASNIAEGSSRNSDVEFKRFLEIAMGSAFEVETQLIISKEIGYLSIEMMKKEVESIHVLQKKLNRFIAKL